MTVTLNVKPDVASPEDKRRTFSPFLATLLGLSLLFAEHYWPSEVANSSTVDFLVESHEGNVTRKAAYLTVGLIGIYLLSKARRNRLTQRTPLFSPLVMLFSWSSLSLLWAEEPDISARRLLVLFLIYLGAIGITQAWSYDTIIRFIAITAAVHLTIGVVAEIGLGAFTPFDPGYRFAGTLRWNEQGLACVFLAMTSLAAADLGKGRLFFRFLLLFGMTFLVLTKSRSSMIAFVASVAVYWLLTKSRRFWTNLMLVGTIFIIGFLATGILGSTYEFLSRQGEGTENFTGRQPLWLECMDFVKERPLTGFGYEDFWTTKRVEYFSGELHWGISAAHSGYLESLLTLGSIGLVLHTGILLLGTIFSVKLYLCTRSRLFALAGCFCLTYLVIGGLEAILVVKASPVSFYFALMLSVVSLPKYAGSLPEPGDNWNMPCRSSNPFSFFK